MEIRTPDVITTSIRNVQMHTLVKNEKDYS